MAIPFIGVGIPWYEREDYPCVVQIMEDTDHLPSTYDEWNEIAEEAVGRIERQGHVAVRVPLNSEKFLAWCRIRGLHVDSSARANFASDPANWPDKH